ncbi:major facilitator superfamily multidrug-resistance, DHA1 sub-family [Mycena latifolia]|nr:major facilitator superfamily multidrug-resistance, DHA1 sub-family [Mycena latifolia]
MPTNANGELVPKRRTPLPKLQLFILLSIQFAEPITGAQNHDDPFVVQFVRDTGITGGDEAKTGFYAGLLESAFFLAETLTVFQFGRLSDIYGRRPVLLFGPFGLALSMLGFGFSKTFWVLLSFRCAQGAFNGNIGVAKTVMIEISDPSNAADMVSFFPVMWSTGATLSPFLGGILANPATKWPNTMGKIEVLRVHPYFLPCAAAASIALASFALALVGLRETLPAVAQTRQKKMTLATETDPLLPNGHNTSVPSDVAGSAPPLRELLTRPVRIALLNHGLLAFCNMAYESLLPLVYSTPISMGGLGLRPHDIGLIMGICGVSNAFVQIVFGGRIIRYFGPRRIFNAAFCGLIFAFLAYPLLNILAKRAGRVDCAVIAVLICQLSCSFLLYFAFASTMIFIMDATPNQASAGSVNGLAQMVGTTLRGAAPSFASSLFSLSVKNNLAGGYLVYAILVGLTLGAVRGSLLLPHRLQSEANRP